jgi:hypothetical protein
MQNLQTIVKILVNSLQPSNVIMGVWNNVDVYESFFHWVAALGERNKSLNLKSMLNTSYYKYSARHRKV